MFKKLMITSIFINLIGSIAFAQSITGDSAPKCGNGKVFNANLNRCILKQSTVETKTKALECEKLEGDEYKACLHKNVTDQMADAEEEGEMGGRKNYKKNYTVPAMMTIAAAFTLFEGSGNLSGCASPSNYVMAGAGAATLLGEILAQKSYKKKLKGLKDKYNAKMVKAEEGESEHTVMDAVTENQKSAFDFQIEQEKARKKAHKTRSTVYMLASGTYAVASAMSIYEAASGEALGSGCSGNYTPKNQKIDIKKYAHFKMFAPYSFLGDVSPSEFKEIIFRQFENLILPTAHADAGGTLMGVIASSGLVAMFSPTLLTARESAAVRAGVTAILSKYSYNIHSTAKKHAKDTDKRIKVIEDLRDSFVNNGGAGFFSCTEEEHNDKGNPGCFCFQPNGKPDPSKVNSRTCIEAFGSADGVRGSQYGIAGRSQAFAARGCFNKQKKFDDGCQCKNQVDKNNKKENNCMRFQGRLNLGGLSKLQGVKNVLRDNLRFNRGEISAADLSGNNNGVNELIGKLKKHREKLEKNPKTKKDMKKLAALERKLENRFSNKVKKGLSDGSLSNPFSNSFGGGGALPTSAKDVLESFKKDLKPITPKFKKGGTLGKGKRKRGLGDFDLGGSGTGGVKVLGDVNEVMNKEYSFNDINDNSANNLFQIITNRYQRSGLRRLFDDKGISQADEASDSDINEK